MRESISAEAEARLRKRQVKRQDGWDEVVLPSLPLIPSGLTQAEKRYLYWLLRETYAATGAVVEVGSWLGSSTIHIAAGLRDAGAFVRPVYTYDNYLWVPFYEKTTGIKLPPGQNSLRPLFDRNVDAYADLIVAQTIDMRDIVWTGGPIDVLFIDAPKDARALADVLGRFADALVPGQTVIAFQDFLYSPAYEIGLLVGRLGTALELLHVVEDGSTATFLVRAPLDALAAPDLDPLTWPIEETIDVWQRIVSEIQVPISRAYLDPGFAMYVYDRGDPDEAIRLFRDMAYPPHVEAQWRRWFELDAWVSRYPGLFAARGMRRSRLDQARRFLVRAHGAALHPRRTLERLAAKLRK